MFLSGSTSRPATTVSWQQTRGTAAMITDATQLATGITLPSLTAPETLTFELTVTDDAGTTAVDSMDVFVDIL